MLVLSRKLFEKIVLEGRDGPITLTVVKLDRNQVRIGIEAPTSVSVAREELLREGPLSRSPELSRPPRPAGAARTGT